MKMEHPEKEIILDDDKNKYYYDINEEEVYFSGVWLSI